MSLKIGITGGIGSGKTTVCKVFQLLGIPVFYADDEAKKLMVSDDVLRGQIKFALGEESYVNEKLDRKFIASVVFNQPDKLAQLNSFVHPAVFKAYQLWHQQQQSPYVLKEAALLFESGSYTQNKFNILVSCPFDLRIRRVMQRDQTTKEKVMVRIMAQFAEEKKEALADFIIQNNEEESIILQVLRIHHLLMKESKS